MYNRTAVQHKAGIANAKQTFNSGCSKLSSCITHRHTKYTGVSSTHMRSIQHKSSSSASQTHQHSNQSKTKKLKVKTMKTLCRLTGALLRGVLEDTGHNLKSQFRNITLKHVGALGQRPCICLGVYDLIRSAQTKAGHIDNRDKLN